VQPLANEDLDHILTHTRPLWDKVRGRRIFISGGTGFFGAWLLESLVHCDKKLALNVQATVLTRNPEAYTRRMPHVAHQRSIQLLRGDVRDFQFPPDHFEFVIHGAAPTGTRGPGEQLELLRTLLDGTRRMLDFAKERGARRFLFVSSGAVYGRQPSGLSHIPEDYRGGPDWLNPAAAYAEGKRVCEQMCALYACEPSLQISIARCFAFVGAHLPLDKHFAIGNFIGDALAGKPIAILGDGTAMRSYLYGADLAIWLWTMLLSDGAQTSSPLVLNVGSSEAVSIHDLAKEVVSELNPRLPIEVAKRPVDGATAERYVPSVQQAEQLLNLVQTIPLRESIRRTAAWHRTLRAAERRG
jgi:dTDP-glucose 4,6-dehydratase